MNWFERKVLVTGAGGFIGSHLVEALLQRHATVHALLHYNSRSSLGWMESRAKESPPNLSLSWGDVRDSHAMRSLLEGVDTVFHLAALIGVPYSYTAPEAYLATNIQGTMSVLQAARDVGVRKFIQTSTSEVYGTARYVPIDEEHPLQAQSPYAASKIGADKMAESFYRSFNLPLTVVRPFNTYGPRQSTRAVIPTIISQALAGEEVRLGSVETVRDMLYVEDTVAGFIAAAEQDSVLGETVNLGTGVGTSIGSIVETVARILNRRIRVSSDEQRLRPPDSEVRKLVACSDKAARLMAWQPRVTLEVGLGRTVEWISAHRDSYQRAGYTY